MRVTTVYASPEDVYVDLERNEARLSLEESRDMSLTPLARQIALYRFESATEYLISHLSGTERAQWIATLYLATGRI